MNSVLIKTNDKYFFYKDTKLYSLHIPQKMMLKQAIDYSQKDWDKYVKRIVDNNLGTIITDNNLINDFTKKAIQIDENPDNILYL